MAFMTVLTKCPETNKINIKKNTLLTPNKGECVHYGHNYVYISKFGK
jgi:hypothetical protein